MRSLEEIGRMQCLRMLTKSRSLTITHKGSISRYRVALVTDLVSHVALLLTQSCVPKSTRFLRYSKVKARSYRHQQAWMAKNNFRHMSCTCLMKITRFLERQPLMRNSKLRWLSRMRICSLWCSKMLSARTAHNWKLRLRSETWLRWWAVYRRIRINKIRGTRLKESMYLTTIKWYQDHVTSMP